MGIQSVYDLNGELFDYSVIERECKSMKVMEQVSQATIEKQIPTENS